MAEELQVPPPFSLAGLDFPTLDSSFLTPTQIRNTTHIMSEDTQNTPEPASVKLLKPHHHFIHIALTLAFYLYMAGVLRNHALVQDESSITAAIMGFFAAVPLGGTFWLACVMFHAVLADHLRRKRNEAAA